MLVKRLIVAFLASVAMFAAEVAVPKGAVESEPGTYSYTDAQGAKWIYRNTPFGMARFKDEPAKPAALDPNAFTKMKVVGGTVYYERQGPFGVYKWQEPKAADPASAK